MSAEPLSNEAFFRQKANEAQLEALKVLQRAAGAHQNPGALEEAVIVASVGVALAIDALARAGIEGAAGTRDEARKIAPHLFI